LERALEIAESYPFLGAFGAGVLYPEYEHPPAKQMMPFVSYLAVREATQPLWSNNFRDAHCIPRGAGLCVTASIARRYLALIHQLDITHVLDRRGDKLCCGGDDLFSWTAISAGQGFGIFPKLRLVHLIAARRVQASYLLPLIESHAYSHGILRFTLFGESPQVTHVIDKIKDLAHGARRGRFSLQCRRAVSRGALAAREEIVVRRLQPLSERSIRGASDGIGLVKPLDAVNRTFPATGNGITP